MYSKVIYLFLSLSLILTSCTEDDENSSLKFRFLEFESDVLLPAVNDRSISFYGIDFDDNLNVWDLQLVNEDNEPFAVEITSVEQIPIGFMNGDDLQKITFKAPPLAYGVYSLAITNTVTGQIYTTSFLVKGTVFIEIKEVEHNIRYTLSHGHGINRVQDLYYFQGAGYTIESDIRKNGIVGITLEDRTTLKKTMIDYSINSKDKVEFVIPVAVTPGTYYLSVNYDNLVDSYFEKDILILEEQYPEITSINKHAFQSGDEIILTGSNFRYKINYDLLPRDDLFILGLNSEIVFIPKGAVYKGGHLISPYESDETYKMINPEGTELKFTFPDGWFPNGFDGEVFVRCGPYLSNPIEITINL